MGEIVQFKPRKREVSGPEYTLTIAVYADSWSISAQLPHEMTPDLARDVARNLRSAARSVQERENELEGRPASIVAEATFDDEGTSRIWTDGIEDAIQHGWLRRQLVRLARLCYPGRETY